MMTPGHPISACEKALRSAIVQGRYTEAQSHLNVYCRAVEETLRALPQASAEGAALADRACRLLAWAQQMTLAGHAHLDCELRQLHTLRQYRSAGPPPRLQTWNLQA